VYRDFLADVEQDIRAAVGGDSDDLALNSLIEISVAAHRDKRPLFQSILQEPAFWRRHFHRIVGEVLGEEDALREATNATFRELTGIDHLI